MALFLLFTEWSCTYKLHLKSSLLLRMVSVWRCFLCSLLGLCEAARPYSTAGWKMVAETTTAGKAKSAAEVQGVKVGSHQVNRQVQGRPRRLYSVSFFSHVIVLWWVVFKGDCFVSSKWSSFEIQMGTNDFDVLLFFRSWRFVFYLCSFWSGLYVLWDVSVSWICLIFLAFVVKNKWRTDWFCEY